MGTQNNAALHFVTETGLAGRSHHALSSDGALAGLDADAVAHSVKTCEVRGNLSRHDQVVGGKRIFKTRAGNLDNFSTCIAQLLNSCVERCAHVFLVSLAGKLTDDAHAKSLDLSSASNGLHSRAQCGDWLVERGGIVGIEATDDLGQCGRVGHSAGHGTNLVQRRGHGNQSVT